MKKESLRIQFFLRMLRQAQHGTLQMTLPDGRLEKFGSGHPEIQIQIKTWDALELILSKGDLGFAEVVIQGDVRVNDTVALIEWACLNEQDLSQAFHGTWIGNLVAKFRHLLNRNNRKGAQKNIMAHYDLGNDFYQLWLDPSMTYSSALFSKNHQDIQSAQMAKYDRIIDQLQIKASDHILEIGCGWGGFFSRAIEKTGCQVTAVMNSPRQAQHNKKMIEAKGLTSHVNLIQQDYRDIEGKFDKVVSIEMIEAVGQQYWKTFFEKVGSSLKEKGAALIQGITIREDFFDHYRKNTDFIQQYVFPGGMLLTNKVFKESGKEQNLYLSDVHEFGLDYAQTLKLWREKFNQVLPEVKALGFDETFIRLWNLYFCYCEGAFRAKRINVGQFLLEK